jgi:hypothetical protein
MYTSTQEPIVMTFDRNSELILIEYKVQFVIYV